MRNAESKKTQRRLATAAVSLLLLAAVPAGAGRWTEEDFNRKIAAVPRYRVIPGADLAVAETVVGSTRYYHARSGDTFLDLARFYSLGFNEIEQANPGIDQWLPPEDQPIVLPTEWVLPQTPYAGVVVNIPEMRLYYFPAARNGEPVQVITYPVGLGRDDWRTPAGKFRVRGKTVNPTWNIPPSIQQERIAEKGFSEKMIPGGHPDNPLGKYRIELTLPMYGIHGTNIPWGVGMQVSHGCVRLYPEDIEALFPLIDVGAPGEFVYQPVKIGARGGRVIAEVHPDIYRLTPGLYREAMRIADGLRWTQRIDRRALERAVQEQSGVPVDVTAGGEQFGGEDLRPARAGLIPHES
jgi:L,D-transpeptidase ErfK/SrfK